jgi:DNA primase
VPQFVRFDKHFLQMLRASVDLSQLIGQDLALRPAGRSFKVRCPFHEERTPSFTVDRQAGFYRCFGCGATGDAIEWLKARHGMSFHDAVRHLAQAGGIALPPADLLPDDQRTERQRLARLYAVLEEAARVFRHGLRKSAEARRYLLSDRAMAPETVTRFELGTVAAGVIKLLRRHKHDTLVEAGLAIEDDDGNLHDRFRHRIMIPIRNEAGSLIGFAGRSLQTRPDHTPKYINSPQTLVFHKGRELYGLNQARCEIRRARTAVVVEGCFDVMTLHEAGEQRAVAPMGTALTADQLRRLLRHADTVVFAFDGDEAGRRAAAAAASLVLSEVKDGQEARFVALPVNADPDSFVRAHGIKAWEAALTQAMPLSKLLEHRVTQDLNLDIAEMRACAAARAHAFLAQVTRAPLFSRALRITFEGAIGMSLSEA